MLVVFRRRNYFVSTDYGNLVKNLEKAGNSMCPRFTNKKLIPFHRVKIPTYKCSTISSILPCTITLHLSRICFTNQLPFSYAIHFFFRNIGCYSWFTRLVHVSQITGQLDVSRPTVTFYLPWRKGMENVGWSGRKSILFPPFFWTSEASREAVHPTRH